MSKVQLRPYQESDLPQVEQLHSLLYDTDLAEQATWYPYVWKWLETHPLADQMHRWVIVDGDRVVGFLGATPQTYRINGQRVVAHTPGDYMIHPDYGFHALSLMRTYFRTCPNTVTCDWLPAVIAVQTRLGTKPVGQLEHFGKPLVGAKLPLPMEKLPGIATRLATVALRAADALLCLGITRGVRLEVVDDFDERFDRFFERTTQAVPCQAEKDAAFLRWRYGPGSPHAEKRVLMATEGGEIAGYAVLRLTTTDRAGYILDLTVAPGRDDVARMLLRHTVRYFHRVGAQLIRYRYLESPIAPRRRDVIRFGFLPRKQRHSLFVKFAEPALENAATSGTWGYNAGDGELGFWVR